MVVASQGRNSVEVHGGASMPAAATASDSHPEPHRISARHRRRYRHDWRQQLRLRPRSSAVPAAQHASDPTVGIREQDRRLASHSRAPRTRRPTPADRRTASATRGARLQGARLDGGGQPGQELFRSPRRCVHARRMHLVLEAFLELHERSICLTRPVKCQLQSREVLVECATPGSWVSAVVEWFVRAPAGPLGRPSWTTHRRTVSARQCAGAARGLN